MSQNRITQMLKTSRNLVKQTALGLVAAALLGAGMGANAAPPVTSGLVLALDASALTGLSDGQQVGTWTDISGNGNNAIATGSTATYKTGVLNGLPVVRFSTDTNASFNFTEITTIRTVFWVVNNTTPGMHFLLGDSGAYDFHAGENGEIWHGQWTSDYIKNGTTKLMGNVVDGTATALPSDSYSLVSLVSTGDVRANTLTLDRTYGRSWASDMAEILIYDKALTTEEEALVGGYLAAKYGLTTSYPPPGPPPAPTGLTAIPLHQAIRLDWTAPASFGVTGYNVYRGTATGTYDATPIGTTTSATTYTDTTAVTGGPYYYVVKATNSSGAGDPSNEASASPSAGPVDQTITFALGLAVTKTAADAPFADTASAFPSGLPVTYSSDNLAVATVDADTGEVTLTGVPGTAPILADQAGNDDFNAAQAIQTLTVNQATPVITWAPTPIVVGTLLSGTQLNATSGGVAGEFVYTPPGGTQMLVVGPQLLSVQFTPTDTFKYSTPALKTVEIRVVPVESTVIWNVVNGAWDTTAANWLGQDSSQTTIFTQGNNVIFNKTEGGTVTIASGMEPLTTTVSAESGTYSFSGGPLAGTGMLTKSGNGNLSINTDNTYSGGTIINAGQVTMEDQKHGALGTGPITLNGGTLFAARINAANALIVNGGRLWADGGWGGTWSGPVTLNGDLTVYVRYYDGVRITGNISGAGRLIVEGDASGLNAWTGVFLSGINTYTGETTLKYGNQLHCSSSAALGSGPLDISNGAKLDLNFTGTKRVESLTLGGVEKKDPGTYGSNTSNATYPDDTYFNGTGTVTVPPPTPPSGLVISIF